MKKSKEGRFYTRKESKVIELNGGFVMCYLYEVHKILFFCLFCKLWNHEMDFVGILINLILSFIFLYDAWIEFFLFDKLWLIITELTDT